MDNRHTSPQPPQPEFNPQAPPPQPQGQVGQPLPASTANQQLGQTALGSQPVPSAQPAAIQPPQPLQQPVVAADQNRELYRMRSLWFIDLPPPPDELVIQEKAVHLIHSELITKRVDTLPLKDVAHVLYTDIPFLASIEIVGNDGSHTLKIRGVPKGQALHAKRILEGLILEKAGEVQVPQNLEAEERREALARHVATPLSAPPTEDSPTE